MSKIGLMGGTFNPIHIGHIELAKAAYEQMCLDEVWFIPSGISYLKKDIKVLDSALRMEMVQIAIEDTPFFKCSDIEIKRYGNTYTVDTLLELSKCYPEHDFYFIMGADSLAYFHNWKRAEDIVKMCTLAVAVRNGILDDSLLCTMQNLEKDMNAKIYKLNFEPIEMASSDIRNKISRKESLVGILPQKVNAFIEEHGLYKD